MDEIGVGADRVGKVGLDRLAGEELGGWARKRRRVNAVNSSKQYLVSTKYYYGLSFTIDRKASSLLIKEIE